MTVDPFGTATLRRVALDAWTADPSRFRQDANLEEDHARGYYRDRVLVELAQNAADAAGHDGRLLLRLTREDAGWVLLAANSGSRSTPRAWRAWPPCAPPRRPAASGASAWGSARCAP